MSPSSDDKSIADALEPVLRDTEAELRNRLRDACEAEAKGVSTESTVAVRQLEDSLLAAAVAAEQAITLRRHIDQSRDDEATAQASTDVAKPSSGMPNETTQPVFRVREFRDSSGQLWRAWPVTPGQARPGRTAERYLGEFHKGWICFEALDSSARRRLPTQPEHWTDLEESELVQLLEQAIAVPERKRREGADRESRPPIH